MDLSAKTRSLVEGMGGAEVLGHTSAAKWPALLRPRFTKPCLEELARAAGVPHGSATRAQIWRLLGDDRRWLTRFGTATNVSDEASSSSLDSSHMVVAADEGREPEGSAATAVAPKDLVDTFPTGNEEAAQGMPSGDLAVVDRDVEVELIMRFAYYNFHLSAGHPQLLYSSQMFGSGKTFLAKNLIPLVNAALKQEHSVLLGSLLDPPAALRDGEVDHCFLSEFRKSQKWTRDLVEQFASLEQDGKKCHEGLWFVFFDEIGVLEDSDTKTRFCDLKDVEKVHTVFFKIIEPFLHHKKVFVFAAGRSQQLALSSKVSPIGLEMLAISALKACHIALTISQTSCSPGVTLASLFGTNTPVKLDQVAEVVYQFTKGIPLYVEPSGPDQYALVFSKYVIDMLKASGINATHLCDLLDFAKSLPVGVVDAGHALVLLTGQVLAMRLVLCERLSDAPCLDRATLVASTPVHPKVGGMFRLAYVASFVKGTSGKPVMFVGPDGHETEKSFDPQDWQAFVEYLFKMFNNTVALPMDNNSAGPDLILPVSDAGGNPSKKQDKFYNGKYKGHVVKIQVVVNNQGIPMDVQGLVEHYLGFMSRFNITGKKFKGKKVMSNDLLRVCAERSE
eukprot:m51a1_g3086 hypothetical protein (619) ;mRNA; r:67416-75468